MFAELVWRWPSWRDVGGDLGLEGGRSRRGPGRGKRAKKSFDSFQNHSKIFSPEDWKVSHTNKVQKLLLF